MAYIVSRNLKALKERKEDGEQKMLEMSSSPESNTNGHIKVAEG